MQPLRPIHFRKAPKLEGNEKLRPTKLDRWLQRFAHGAAPLALVLALLGYVFTVRPVFQYQRLQEQSAKLELERERTEAQLVQLRSAQAEVERNIQRLNENWEAEKRRSEQLASDASLYRLKEREARKRATAIESALHDEQDRLAAVQGAMQRDSGNLDTARWELINLDLTSAYYFPWLQRVAKGTGDRNRRDGTFIKEAKEGWPSPYRDLLAAVDTIETNNSRTHEIPKRYFDEIRSFFRAREGQVSCAPIDFDAMYGNYEREGKDLDRIIDAETTASLEQTRKEYAEKGQSVQITDQYRRSTRRTIEIGKEFELGSRYRAQLQEAEKTCREKGASALRELAQAKGARR